MVKSFVRGIMSEINIYPFIILFPFIFMCGVISADVFLPDVKTEGDSLEILANIYPGSYNLIAKKDSFCFVGTKSTIIIYDVSNPSSPEIIDRIFFDEEINFFYVYSDYLFVSGPTMTCKIYDISNPAETKYISQINVYIEDMAVKSDFAYISYEDNLAVYNISDILSPLFVKNLELWPGYSTTRVDIDGNYLYVIARYYELYIAGDFEEENYFGNMRIYNLSNLSSPAIADEAEIDYSSDISVEDGYAYICNRTGLDVYNVSTATNITYTSSYPQTFGTLNCTGDTLIASKGGYGFYVLNIADPRNIELTAQCNQSTVNNFSLSGNIMFSVGYDNFSIFEDYLTSRTLLYKSQSESDLRKTILHNGYMYSLENDYKLLLYRIDSEYQPVKINYIYSESNKWIIDYVLHDHYLFMLRGYYLHNEFYGDEFGTYFTVYNISNPYSPVTVALAYDEDKCFIKAKVIGDTLYALEKYVWGGDSPSIIKRYSLVDLPLVSALISIQYDANVTDISYYNGMILSSTADGKLIIRREQDSNDPMEEKSFILDSPDGCMKIEAINGTILAYMKSCWLLSIKINRVPLDIIVLDSLFIGSTCASMTANDGYLYLSNGASGLYIVKIEANGNMALIDSFDTKYFTYSSCVDNDKLYIADPSTGLWILSNVYSPYYGISECKTKPAGEEEKSSIYATYESGGVMFLNLINFDYGNTKIIIGDISGRIVFQRDISVSSDNEKLCIPKSDFPAGLFFVYAKDKGRYLSAKFLNFGF